MVTGEFTDDDQIIVMLTLKGNQGEAEVEVVVDTGFTGSLMLPTRLINQLGLTQLDVTEAVMADGTIARLPVCEATLMWNEEERTVLAYAGDGDALLGISMLRNHIGTFEFYPGGVATIEPV